MPNNSRMTKIVSSESSSMSYLYKMLTSHTDTYCTKTSSKYHQLFSFHIEAVVESLGNTFRRMIVNKNALRENIFDNTIKVHQYEIDNTREVHFFLNVYNAEDIIFDKCTYSKLLNSDEFYSKLNNRLNQVFSDTSNFIQNKLYDYNNKIYLIRSSELFAIYPKIRFTKNKILITGIVCINQ